MTDTSNTVALSSSKSNVEPVNTLPILFVCRNFATLMFSQKLVLTNLRHVFVNFLELTYNHVIDIESSKITKHLYVF